MSGINTAAEHYYDTMANSNLRHVSHTQTVRQRLLALPSAWARAVDIHSGHAPEYFELALQRSLQHPLNVDFNIYDEDHGFNSLKMRRLFAEIGRFERLKLQVMNEVDCRRLPSMLSQASPLLKSLNLSSKPVLARNGEVEHRFIDLNVNDLFAGYAPNLRALRLENITLAVVSPLFRNIKSLNLSYSSTFFVDELRFWYQMIASMPKLETLVLEGVTSKKFLRSGNAFFGGGVNPPTICLPKLKNLRICGSLAGIANAYLLLSPPDDCTCVFEAELTDSTDGVLTRHEARLLGKLWDNTAECNILYISYNHDEVTLLTRQGLRHTELKTTHRSLPNWRTQAEHLIDLLFTSGKHDFCRLIRTVPTLTLNVGCDIQKVERIGNALSRLSPVKQLTLTEDSMVYVADQVLKNWVADREAKRLNPIYMRCPILFPELEHLDTKIYRGRWKATEAGYEYLEWRDGVIALFELSVP
ncbi:hypothetical protein FA15DRAFT_653191 [Coprinopsis marcescibilis]|uniref:F-box domain-containing protein n=1 Tax=Coprinopsis marcescibilis TaxID=230819 RepID=A0A5C3L5F8_COPMA|nr:hypothetical protein FA15DRAFT_653191 [Coprinopsis marcescibilis]